MKSIQHLIFMFCAGLPIWFEMYAVADIQLGWFAPGALFGAMCAGTFFPDIEYIESYMWEGFKPYSVLVRSKRDKNCPDTSYLHSLFGLFSSTAVYFLLFWALSIEEYRTCIYAGFAAGLFFVFYAIHLLQDILIMPGVRLFWPVGKPMHFTNLMQKRDMDTRDLWHRKFKSWPVIFFTICLILVSWAVCLYIPSTVQGVLYNIGEMWANIMAPVISVLNGLFGEKLFLTILRTLLVILFIPILFRTPLTKYIESLPERKGRRLFFFVPKQEEPAKPYEHPCGDRKIAEKSAQNEYLRLTQKRRR